MRLVWNVPHPIPYQGSKRYLAPRILDFVPENTKRLVEPFSGSAAISLAAAWTGKVKQFWLNDINAPLVELWQEILDRPDELNRAYKALWEAQSGRERQFYDEIRDRFNRQKLPADFLYFLARCVKACVRYNANGEFNNSPDNRRLGAKPFAMQSRIFGANQLLAGRTKLTHVDFENVLAACKPTDVIYMDPPYQGVCGDRNSRYISGISHEHFVREVEHVLDRDCRIIISYDGRTGEKRHGKLLPDRLDLAHMELPAGRSTTATLLGRNDETFESLYVSKSLLATSKRNIWKPQQEQLALFGS